MPVAYPSIRIDDVVVDESAQVAIFRVFLSTPNWGQSVTVNYGTGGGNATSGADYTSVFGSLTFAPGVTERFITVPILDDNLSESTEMFNVNLSGATNATLVDSTATAYITDNDNTPRPTVGNATVTEGGTLVHTVTLSAAASTPVVYSFSLAGGTATAGTDFSTAATFSNGVTLSGGKITVPAGVTSFTVSYATVQDTLDEQPSETTVLSICQATGTGTIVDDDTTTISRISNATINEGGTLAHTVTLSGPSAIASTYAYNLAGGTATAGTDFSTAATFSNGVTLSGGRITVPAGVTRFTVSYATVQDTIDEQPSETTRLTIGGKVATGVIVDDDTTPSLLINDVTVNEAAGLAVFTVSLSAASGQAVTVAYNTSNGSAVAASDYTSIIGTLTFAAGQTSKTVTVPILDDATLESSETFNVNLTAATNATIADNLGVGMIVDNDAPPPGVVSVSAASTVEGSALVHTVILSGQTTATTSYVFGLTGYGTAIPGSDFSTDITCSNGVYQSGNQLIVPAGVSSFTATYATFDDYIVERDGQEITRFAVVEPLGGTGASNYGTIIDNDVVPPSVVSLSYAQATEGAALVHTVTLSAATTGTATYDYALGGFAMSGATAGSDFATNPTFSNGVTLSGGKLIVPAGVSSFTITIATIDDSLVESTEYTLLSVGGHQNLGYIVDNDLPPPTVVHVGNAYVTEGNSAVHTVTLSGTTTGISSYNYYLSGYGSYDTATAGSDFSATPTFSNGVYQSGTQLIVPAGVSSFTVTYSTFDDSIVEPEEHTQLMVGGILGSGSIYDNDVVAPPSVISVSAATATEGAALVHTVTLSGTTTRNESYSYGLVGHSATDGSDFWAGAATFSNGVYKAGAALIVPAGVSSFTVTYTTVDDSIMESPENTQLTVGGATNFGTIMDNDAPPPGVVSVSAASTVEGSALAHTVTLSGTTTASASYSYSLAGGVSNSANNATAGSDFSTTATFSNGVYQSGDKLIVPAGVSSFTVTYTTVDDSIVEWTEYAQVSVGGVIGNGAIMDNDVALTVVSVSAATATEGAALVHTVTLSGTTTRNESYSYGLVGHSATDGSDFWAGAATFSNGVYKAGAALIVPAGVSSFTVTYTTVDDSIMESPENTQLTVGGATNFGTIIDNDVAVVSVVGGSGYEDSFMTFTINLSATTTTTMYYDISRTGTATPTADFLPLGFATMSNGVIVDIPNSRYIVPPGVSSFTATARVYNDSIYDPNETVNLIVGGVTGTWTILDAANTHTNEIYIENCVGREGRDSLQFLVTRTGDTNMVSTVNYITSDGTATAGLDYQAGAGTLTFGRGETSKYVTVPTYYDNVAEPGNELLYVTLSNVRDFSGTTGEELAPRHSIDPWRSKAAGTICETSPIILDLDGDGVRSVGVEAGVNFDVSNTGLAHKVGWVSAQDGLLVRDIDHNGKIDNGAELFGTGTSDGQGGKTGDGFQALALVDSNQDGAINSLDLGWKDLQVWRDANTDGVTDKGELHSLDSLGVQSLNLAYTTSNKVENGNMHMLLGDYTTTSGETREMTDVFFATGDRAATEAVALQGKDATATGLTFDPTASVWQIGAEAGNVLIKGFDAEHDVLDLRDLLPGQQGDNLDGLLSIKKEGSSTVIGVKDAAGADHSIIFAGVDLLGGNSDQQVIHDLLNSHKVVVD